MLFLPRASHNFSAPFLIKSKGCVKDKEMGLAPLVLNGKTKRRTAKNQNKARKMQLYVNNYFQKQEKIRVL